MDFLERLDGILKENKMTAKELTMQLGIGKTTINDWKRGKSTPSPKTLIGISHIFNVSIDWLLTGEGEMYKNASSKQDIPSYELKLLERFKKLGNISRERIFERIETLIDMEKEMDKPATEEYGRVKAQPGAVTPYNEQVNEQIEKKVFDLPASAGLGNYLDGGSPFEMISFDVDLVPDEADFGIRITGDSMEPKIHDKDIVWIKEQVQIENGQIGIFIFDGEAYCKKLSVDYKNQELKLISLNKKYKPMIVNRDAVLKTVGKVLFI